MAEQQSVAWAEPVASNAQPEDVKQQQPEPVADAGQALEQPNQKLVVNQSEEAKQDDDSRNYATNQPSKSVQEFQKEKVVVGFHRMETMGAVASKSIPKKLDLSAQDVSHQSSLSGGISGNLGEATPGFHNRSSQEQPLPRPAEESNKFVQALGQIPEVNETPQESVRAEGADINTYDTERIQIQTATFPENEQNKFRTEQPANAVTGTVKPSQVRDQLEKQSSNAGDPQREFTSEQRSPRIQVDADDRVDYESVAPIEINRELLLRLLTTGTLSESETELSQSDLAASKQMKCNLNKKTSAMYLNGVIFSRYLIFLKKHMKHKYNQIWSIKIHTMHEVQQGLPPDVSSHNWQLINAELDKISINIAEGDLSAIIKGDQAQIDRIFTRIERYSKIITDSNFLKFEDLKEEERYADDMDDSTVHNLAITDENLSELISLRQQNTMRSNISKPSTILTKMITRGITKHSSKFIETPLIGKEGALKNGPEKSLTMLDNGLRIRGQNSAFLQKSQDNAAQSHIKVTQDFVQDEASYVSPKPTEGITTDGPDNFDPSVSPFSPKLNVSQNEVPKQPPKTAKQVKDGVDILALDANKAVASSDSSLELILITLSQAFRMNPKQAAALLTNNNQYLITACIKGVKGGKYEPLISWYELLIDNQMTLATLLTLELEQLPASARQTFVRVMAAIGCGFFSYNSELVFLTFSLFTRLFGQLKARDDVHALALKWFLSQSPLSETSNEEMTAEKLVSDEKATQPSHLELVLSGGLRLSLYAITKHREATRHAMQLYQVLCDSDNQMMFTLYTAEIQKNTKSVLEYMELVGEFLPLMSETDPEKAIESGLVDFWLDLSSREAENDFKMQNKEKVLAISLLTEIWLLFTDYIDEKEAATNTLLFVFKRTVSERAKSIRLISIAYLFKVLERLIELKKKAALTLYRTLIFSLVESPFDPTIRELYLANFAELFRNNAKIPVEWLVEPLLKQITTQLGVTFVLKVFDFTFMLSLVTHPKFKEDHSSLLFTLFAQVGLDETSYATASHEILVATLRRFLSVESKNSSELLEKAKEHIRLLFESLLELEPVSKAAAQAQMKRQQRQNVLKLRSGLSGGGRQSQLSMSIQHTPGSNKPPLKAKDLLGQGKQTSSMPSFSSSLKSNYQKDMQRRLRKSLIITLLLRLQALNVDSLNKTFLKTLLFEKTVEFKATFGYFNKGHLELLKYYGDPDQLILDRDLDPVLTEQGKLEREQYSLAQVGQRNGSLAAKNATPHTQAKNASKPRNLTPSSNNGSELRNFTGETREGVVALYNIAKEDVADFARQVVPYTEGNSQRNKSVGRARALQEIEKIKKLKKERESKKEAELEKLRKASAQRKKRAKIEVDRRKQELGVADRQPSKLPSLSDPNERASQSSSKPKTLQLVRLEEEEDRDRETVNEFMRKYQKLWRNIFAKYQNTGHKQQALARPSFDLNRVQTLTFAETTKLLKDHGVYPNSISKEELSQMIRLINQRAEEPHTDVSTLTYNGYQSLIVQLAAHIFSRPPIDLSRQPMVKSLETLVQTFLEATRKRNLSTLLYEDPDAVVAMTREEKDLLKSLNEKVKAQPDYPIPDGFLKVKERVPVIEHRVPPAALPVIGEARAVCVEVVDELVSKLFDFHVLESVITMQEQYRVKPSIQRSLLKAKPERSERAEALSIIRRAEERRSLGESGPSDNSTRNINRISLPKLSSGKSKGLSLEELPPIYKELVRKAPKAKQGIYEEVAFVVEGMVRRLLGEPSLDGTESSIAGSREGGSVSDKAGVPPSEQPSEDQQFTEEQRLKYEQLKQARARQNLQEQRQKEKKRQERQRKLKEDLAKLKEEKVLKEEEDAQKRKEEAKKKKESDKKLEERRQKQREELIQEIASKKEEREAKNIEKVQAEQEEEKEKERQQKIAQKEFFKKQQEKMNTQFKSMTAQRKASTLQEQQRVEQEKKQKDALKKKVNEVVKQGQGHGERQLASEIASFLLRAEVGQLFSDHQKSLLKYFKFYCKQNRVELGHDLQYRLEHLDFGAFNKLGLQSKLVPVLLSSEQLKLIYRNTLKYQLNNSDLQVVQKPSSEEAKDLQAVPVAGGLPSQMDFEQFKQALVRVAIQGQELLGGQSEEQRQRKARLDEKRRQAEQKKKELLKNRQEQRARLESETLAEMRAEFGQKQRQILAALSKTPSKRLDKVQSDGDLASKGDDARIPVSEEDFQKWLKQQEAIGNGLSQRVADKLNSSSKAKPAHADAATAEPAVEGGTDAKPGAAGAEDSSPAKLLSFPDHDNESLEEIGGGSAPLLRAKQNQAQNSGLAEAAVEGHELDIAFISADTVKALFEFMKVEAGDEGERNVDGVLAAQSSYQGRGRAGNGSVATVNPGKRGVSKEPTAGTSARELDQQ